MDRSGDQAVGARDCRSPPRHRSRARAHTAALDAAAPIPGLWNASSSAPGNHCASFPGPSARDAFEIPLEGMPWPDRAWPGVISYRPSSAARRGFLEGYPCLALAAPAPDRLLAPLGRARAVCSSPCWSVGGWHGTGKVGAKAQAPIPPSIPATPPTPRSILGSLEMAFLTVGFQAST